MPKLSKAKNHAAITHRFVLPVLLCCLTACTQPADTKQTLPPGFTDAAPPPPTSNTLVLSGGTLLLEPPLNDAVVVIENGNILAWGKRGEVNMPNDSIGRDMRGKWLQPETNTAPGQAANLIVYASDPQGQPTPTPEGYVRNGTLDMPPDSD